MRYFAQMTVNQRQQRELNQFGGVKAARLAQTTANLLAALDQQTVQIVDHAVDLRAVVGVEHRRDVAVVEPHVVVVTFLCHKRHADGGPFRREVFFQHQGQTQAAKLDGGIPHRHGVVVFHLLLESDEARQRGRLFAKNHLFSLAATNRQREHHLFVGEVVRNFQRYRTVAPVTHLEKGAVRQQATAVAQGNASLTKHRFIQFNVEKAPEIRSLQRAPFTNMVEQIAFSPLKMVWTQEHAFGPDDLFCFRHDDVFPV